MKPKAKEKGINLVIVESPAKAKTIEKFLGKDFLVKSSYGHIRDLEKKGFGIDISNNYQPQYIISPEKRKIVEELRQFAASSSSVWLASDEDREGEAIAWHLSEVLSLNPATTRRIVFHEITKDAILNAVASPRGININLVNAQQARRVLDRLVGFELSPVLWKKVRPSLSAGRVQSVAVRLIVEREREIFAFQEESAFRVTALFKPEGSGASSQLAKAELNHRFKTEDEMLSFLKHCAGARFAVSQVARKPYAKSPAAPFTTSTLQQEASRKLGFSVAQTMSVAQKLYEAGKITYMRTDSVNLSDSAIAMAVQQVKSEMGQDYVKVRKYKTKSKGAQEAHEAIRPTYLDNPTIQGTSAEQRLYSLIYKRALASQMADAQIEKTSVTINISGSNYQFIASGEAILFDGFLKVYIESSDNEGEDDEETGFLPLLKQGESLLPEIIEARERWTQKPPRFSEASLVRKLEELGIGRPSTYSPTISTIQQRGYVVKEDRPGQPRKYHYSSLVNGKVTSKELTEMHGAERAKMFPADIGMVVNDFLVKYFPNVVNYDFTAEVEKEFDLIAAGQKAWNDIIHKFYVPFHQQVEETLEKSDRNSGERVLGTDPSTGKRVSVRIGRYGPMAQIGEALTESEKPLFASLTRDQHIETITLSEALKLFELPRKLGMFENKEVVVGTGRFGPYVKHDGKFTSISKNTDDPLEIDLQRATELIQQKRERDNKKILKSFDKLPTLQILNGRWGPFISFDGGNYKLPKNAQIEELTLDDCIKIVEAAPKVAKKSKKSPILKSKTKPTTKKVAGEKLAKPASGKKVVRSKKQ